MNLVKLKLVNREDRVLLYEYINVDHIDTIDIRDDYFAVTVGGDIEYQIAKDDPYIAGIVRAADQAAA